MKIVHVALYWPVMDGLNYQDNVIAKYHQKDGHEVTIITSKWVYDEKGKLVYQDKSDYFYDCVKMIRLDLKFGKNVESKFKIYKDVYKMLENLNPDCIFIHNLGFFDLLSIRKYIIKNNIQKVYVDNHCDFQNSGKNIISKFVLHYCIWRTIAKYIEPYVNKFYGVLPVRVDFLTDVYGIKKEKCELLVMGADDEYITKAIDPIVIKNTRKLYGCEEDDFFIVTGGKINHNRPETLQLMEAVKNSSHKNIKLLIFGTVNDDLKEKFELLIDEDRVIYAGWQNAIGTYKLMASADLVAFPGLHSVMWEQAVALGVPTIFRKIEGVKHIDIGGNCDYFDELTASEMQKKLESLYLDKQKLAKMREIAQNGGRDYFSYKNIARKSIYLEEI